MRIRALVATTLVFAACANPADPEDVPDDAGVDGGPSDVGSRDAGVDVGTRDGGIEDAGADLDASIDDRGGIDATPIVIVEVAYGANAEDPSIQHLYLTESSTIARRVTPDLAGAPAGGEKQPETGGLVGIHWTFDGSRLVYEAHQDNFDVVELYQSEVVDSRPRPPTKITASNAVGYASLLQTSPVANAIIFDQGHDYFVDLTATPLAPAQFNTGSAGRPTFSPDGSQIAFRDIIVSANDRDLWFYHIASGTKERVNPGANLGSAAGPFWTPDGSRLIYAADEVGLRRWQFFFVPVNGATLGARQPLHDVMPADRNPSVAQDASELSPDGRWLAITADVRARSTLDLVVLDLTQPFPQALEARSAPAVADVTGVVGLAFNATSDRLAYRAFQDSGTDLEAYVTDLSFASAPVKVSPPATGGSLVTHLEWAKGGDLLLMRVQRGPEADLYAVDTTTLPPGPAVLVSTGFAIGQRFLTHGLSPDGRTLLLQARDDASNFSLYTVDLRGAVPGPPVEIAQTPGGSVYCWSPDGARFAFSANLDSPTTTELYLSDPELPTPVKISGPMIDGAKIFRCSFPPR